MKGFLRTAPGKCLIFLMLIVSCVAAGVGIVGTLLFTTSDMSLFYTSEDTFMEQTLEDMVRSSEDDIVWHYFDGNDSSYLNRFYGETRTNLLIRLELVTPQGVELLYANTGSFEPLCVSYFTSDWQDDNGFVDRRVYDSPPPFRYENAADDTDPNAVPSYYKLSLGLKEGLPVSDRFQAADRLIRAAYKLKNWAVPLAAGCGLLSVFLFVVLMTVAGHRPGTEEIRSGLIEKVPYDVYTIVIGGLVGLILFAAIDFMESGWRPLSPYGSDLFPVLAMFVAAVGALCLFLFWAMSTAVRVKDRSLVKNTVLWLFISFLLLLLRGFFSFLGMIPVLWKSLALYAAFSVAVLAGLFNGDEGFIFCLWVVASAVLMYCLYMMQKLHKGAKAVSEGHYEQKVDPSLMVPGFRRHAEYINTISSGLNRAVEERMKSERMKTELITNVSHDIKTPLTSIINYSDLICREETENEAIKEYADVLHRQSERLKRLIEDLIEASKASTGNIEMEMARCDLNVIVSQISGEYEERLTNADLSLIARLPESPTYIMADGRRLWRVFDNLMNNIVKYAMPGTRVYISMAQQNGEAVMVFKNTSRDPLDLTPEELTERFVRGDASRNTEGNGLGLSIAKSLVELQNGQLNLYADGDLFKVILRFPLCA